MNFDSPLSSTAVHLEDFRAALLECEAVFNETFDQMAIGIAHVGLNLRIRRVNRKFCGIVGHPREELLKHTLEEIALSTGLDLISVRRILAGEASNEPSEHLIKTGLWINLSVSLVRDSENDPKYYIIFIEDISERKRAEEELSTLNRKTLELARRNDELEEFVYVVSHDLRAPLVNMQGFSEELEDSCSRLESTAKTSEIPKMVRDTLLEITQEEFRVAIKFIKAGARRFERLIDALLVLSQTRRQHYEAKIIDVHALVRNLLDATGVQIKSAGAQVTVGELPPAQGDSVAIGQVFSNLLLNAIKYLKPGRPGLIEIAGKMQDGMIHYRISDNGSGFPESVRGKLFQVFQRFHPKLADGEGMGLAIVKRIIEGHGGKVWASYNEGLGTTFHFTLPTGKAIGVHDAKQ